MKQYDIVVVGAGPAGLTAALYAARAGRQVLVLEKEVYGGQIVYSPRVENYPGIPRCSGMDLADGLVGQVKDLGVTLEPAQVTALTPQPGGFLVEAGGKSCIARAVILATGLHHKALGLEGETALVGRGLSYCATCDGAFFRGRDVAVVGGGDAALQEALFLSQICRRVFLIHRRDEFRGEARLAAELREKENVELLLSRTPQALLQENGILRGLRLKNLKTEEITDLAVDGMFLAVGHIPQNENFRALVKLDGPGYVDAGEDCTTGTPGIFVAGDCRRKTVRQLTTAVGDGAVSAVAACSYLDHL